MRFVVPVFWLVNLCNYLPIKIMPLLNLLTLCCLTFIISWSLELHLTTGGQPFDTTKPCQDSDDSAVKLHRCHVHLQGNKFIVINLSTFVSAVQVNFEFTFFSFVFPVNIAYLKVDQNVTSKIENSVMLSFGK